jgi:hypothetical protein
MKTKWINLSTLAVIVMALSFFMVSCEKDDAMLSDGTALTKSSTVVIYDEDYDPPAPSVEPYSGLTGPGGNVTCEQVADYYDTEFDYSTDRLNWEDGKFTYEGDEVAWPKGLTVTVTNDTYVSFSLTDPFKIGEKCYLVGAVIVKGGNAPANVYYYANGTDSDEGLRSPNNQGGQQSELSNLTFCLIEVECPAEEECWNEETAFGGDTAGEGAAWWFAFDTTGDPVQSIYAGQKKVEGANVKWDAVNDILTIDLGPNMELQPESETESVHPRTGAVTTKINDEQVKVQGYDVLPASRPAAGQFTLYKGRELVIQGDGSPFYVIHLDVEVKVDCEE